MTTALPRSAPAPSAHGSPAPGHGIIWEANPNKIIERYLRYADYSDGPREKEIAIIWGSMYGNTELGLKHVIEGIESEEKVPIRSIESPMKTFRLFLPMPIKAKVY